MFSRSIGDQRGQEEKGKNKGAQMKGKTGYTKTEEDRRERCMKETEVIGKQ